MFYFFLILLSLKIIKNEFGGYIEKTCCTWSYISINFKNNIFDDINMFYAINII